MRSNIFDRLSFLSLFSVIVLLPIFSLPGTSIPVETSKGLLLVVGLAACIVFWSLARFFDGKIILPRSICLLGGAGVVLAIFLSAIFSKASQVSFFGTMFDISTFWFIFSGFLLMLMSSIILLDHKRARVVLFGAIVSSAVVFTIQIVHLFVPSISLGILVDKTSNLLGSWNAFGLFAGFSALMSLLVVEFFPATKIEKLLLQALVIFSLFFVAAVNFLLVWELLGIFSLIIFVYKVSINSRQNKDEGEKVRFPAFSFIIIMIALLFFMSGNFIGGVLPDRLGIQNNEINPSLGATVLVTKSVLKDNPILGIGPNRFEEAWATYKPLAVNQTPFWDISFSSGSGLLTTLASTTGGLGILALLLFFALLITNGVKSIFSSIKTGANWETMAFFILSIYLFISSFFYSTGAVIFLLALAFAGVFIGLSAQSHQKGEILISFLNDHRKSFFSILFLILMVTACVAMPFKYVERLMSVSYFAKALTAETIGVAEASIGKALALYVNDLYLRTYAQVYLIKLNSLVKDGTSLTEADKANLQANLDQAVNGAQLATAYNPRNYLNFQALGSLYQSLALFGVKDAYSKAVEAYKIASTLNPLNPKLKLSMASATFADGNKAQAKDYANAALALKPDYVDALIVLSQIAKNEGDDQGAISYAQKALSIIPDNKDLIKYVDSLKNPSSSNTAVPPTATTTSNATPKIKASSTIKKK